MEKEKVDRVLSWSISKMSESFWVLQITIEDSLRTLQR